MVHEPHQGKYILEGYGDRVRIVSDGTPLGTFVFLHGQQLEGVQRVVWEADINQMVNKLTIELVAHGDLDLISTQTEVKTVQQEDGWEVSSGGPGATQHQFPFEVSHARSTESLEWRPVGSAPAARHNLTCEQAARIKTEQLTFQFTADEETPAPSGEAPDTQGPPGLD